MELERGLKQIEITPLIDMIFLLLIFFLLTSGFVLQPGIKVDLPKAATGEFLQPQGIEVVISGENVTYFNGNVLSVQELKKLIGQAAKRKQAVLIKSDRRASLGRMIEVWDICRDAGVSRINIATNQ